MTDTSHLRACRNALDNHKETCDVCEEMHLCPIGLAALDELCAAITANPSCENLEAKSCETT